MTGSVRIDKWLWAVRIFKTRSIASDACRSGKVHIGGVETKPSRELKIGDIIVLNLSSFKKTVRVTGLLNNRVGAKLVTNFLEDLTPSEEYEKLELVRNTRNMVRPHGLGRPTKKERRDIDKFRE